MQRRTGRPGTLRGALHRGRRGDDPAETLRASERLHLILYALAVILMMLFMPKGLGGLGLWDWLVAPRAR
jgi:ABC-type branched-subunit amino acid transport system permease subunit